MLPGTFAVKPETMKAILTDAVGCLKNWGFKTVIFVNGHGDPTHGKAQAEVAAELRQSLGIGVYASGELKPKGFTPPAWPARPANSYEPDYHAGARTSPESVELMEGAALSAPSDPTSRLHVVATTGHASPNCAYRVRLGS